MKDSFDEKPHIDLIDDQTIDDKNKIDYEKNENEIPKDLKNQNIISQINNNSNIKENNNENEIENNDKIEVIPPKETTLINQRIHLDKEVRFSNFNTLDESVSSTLTRDLRRICHKLEYVLIPRIKVDKRKELQNWDLWGPLIFCLLLCLIISSDKGISAEKSFVYIFFIVWIGGVIITFNAQFLGAVIGICQSCCLLGYCVFPILIGALILRLYKNAKPVVKVIIMGLTVVWSCFSSVGFMSTLSTPNKKFLMVFPVYLFYVSIAIFILNV